MTEIELLLKKRSELQALGSHPGSVQVNGNGYRLVWYADGEKLHQTIQRCEADKYRVLCARHRQLMQLNKAIARIQSVARQALAEVAA